jgi:hypothetical protein
MAAILSPLSTYGDNRKTKLPLLHKTRIHAPEGHFGNSCRSTIGQMPGDRTSLSLDASLAIPTRVLRFEASRRARIPYPPAEPPVLVLWFNQVTRQFSGEPPQTPRANSGCEPLPCTGSDRRLRLAFLATMRPALDPWPSGPSSQAYLSLHSSEAPQGIDLSRPLFTCTNANQAATCTCNTRPRVSPHHVFNHSSQPGATIHRSSDAPVLNLCDNPPRKIPYYRLRPIHFGH